MTSRGPDLGDGNSGSDAFGDGVTGSARRAHRSGNGNDRKPPAVRPRGHENVATVLVDPDVLGDFELDLMSRDFRVWEVQSVPTFLDGPRLAFQIRRSLVEHSRGAWDIAADWTLCWITFGESWLDGDEPIPWPAHAALWDKLAEYRDRVRYNVGLGGVPRLSVTQERS